nr:putative reverse transcriptase domain-containing protein [Tanacetum cinerariifolium]
MRAPASLLRRGAWSSFEVSIGITEEGEVSSVKDKILATPIETSKVENVLTEMLRDLDQQMEKRADDGKAIVVTDALSRKERVKPRRVRAMAMTIQYGSEMDDLSRGLADATESVRDAIGFESHVLWAEIRESSLTGLELVQETTDKVVLGKGKSQGSERSSKELCEHHEDVKAKRSGQKDRSYSFSDSLLLTPLYCDDINVVMPRVSALARSKMESMLDKPVPTDVVLSRYVVEADVVAKGSLFQP